MIVLPELYGAQCDTDRHCHDADLQQYGVHARGLQDHHQPVNLGVEQYGGNEQSEFVLSEHGEPHENRKCHVKRQRGQSFNAAQQEHIGRGGFQQIN